MSYAPEVAAARCHDRRRGSATHGMLNSPTLHGGRVGSGHGHRLDVAWLGGGTAQSAEHVGKSPGENTCVDCHWLKETAQQFDAWSRDHFVLWYVGVHGRNDVPCDKCHGGEPNETEKAAAHRGLRSSRDPESRIYYKNLPETCGTCHEQVYRQFVRSKHYKALIDDRLAPSCSTCHGFMMEIEPAMHSIAERCALCHNSRTGVKPDVADTVRAVLDHIARARQAIEKARLTIELARDRGRETARAEDLVSKAEELIDRTPAEWHRFQLVAFETELAAVEAVAERARVTAMDTMLEH